MSDLLQLLSLSRRNLIQVIVLSVCVGVINTALLYFLSSAQRVNIDLWHWIFAVFAVTLLGFIICQRFLLKSLVRQSESVFRQIRIDLFKSMLLADFAAREDLGRSKPLSAFTHDAVVISQFWPMLVNLMVSVITIASSLAYLGFLSLAGLAITLATISVALLAHQLITSRAKKSMEHARDYQDEFLSSLDDLLNGAKELKINRRYRRDLYANELIKIVDAYYAQNSRAKMLYHDAGLLGHGMFFTLAGLVAFILPSINVIPIDTQTAFLVVLLYLMGPLTRITANLPFIGNAQVSIRRVRELQKYLGKAQEQSCDLADKESTRVFADNWQTLTLNNAFYTYSTRHDGVTFELGPLSLDINRGELLFIVGGNGSGKSTLGKLLTGLYLPTSGKISVDQTEVHSANVDDYRQLFSVVYSDFHLFNRIENLNEAEQLHATRLLKDLELPESLIDTKGNDSFSKLSKGQQRRLAMAIASLDDRPIYFFDEWAADQDPVFRQHYYARILPELRARGKTVIAVTHDDRFFSIADRVVKLDKGTFFSIEQGGCPIDKEVASVN